MNSSYILSYVTYLYFLSALAYILFFTFSKNFFRKLGLFLGIIGAGGNLYGFILRWIESYEKGIGHIPLSNMYESLIVFALIITIFYVVLEYKYKSYSISVLASVLALTFFAYASLSKNISSEIKPLIPALKSNWLTIHVITCFLAYAAFAISFVISLLYLFPQKLKELKENILDDLNYNMIVFAFLFLSLGIITGSIWANSAWGKYWSWDPKETWSLITWLIYASLLHFKRSYNWSGKKIAILSIIGFMGVLFTYFGINFLISGLHSYA